MKIKLLFLVKVKGNLLSTNIVILFHFLYLSLNNQKLWNVYEDLVLPFFSLSPLSRPHLFVHQQKIINKWEHYFKFYAFLANNLTTTGLFYISLIKIKLTTEKQ